MRGVRPSWHKGIIQPPTLPEDQRGRTPAGKLGNTPQATDGLVQCTLNFLEILLQERQLCEMRSHLCVCVMNLSSRHFRSWTPKLLLPGEVFDSSCVLLEGGDHIGPQDSQPPPPPPPILLITSQCHQCYPYRVSSTPLDYQFIAVTLTALYAPQWVFSL